MEEMVTQARKEASPPPERIKPVVHVTKTMTKSPRNPPKDSPMKEPDPIALDASKSPKSDAEEEKPESEALGTPVQDTFKVFQETPYWKEVRPDYARK